MVNTYPEDTSMETKTYEEMRCVRCLLERILRVMDEGLFVDYQMEKYGKEYKTIAHLDFETNTQVTEQEKCN